MIIKRAFTFDDVSNDKIQLSFPGQTSTFDHYPTLASHFYQCFAEALNEFGVSFTYNSDTGLGTIADVPVMIIYSPATVYFWCVGMGSSYSSVNMSYSGYDNRIRQSVGFSIKGTKNSFAVYMGSGSSVGVETYAFAIISMKRMYDNVILKGFMNKGTKPILYTIENDEYVEMNEIVKPATDYANSGAGYKGLALVPAVTCSLAYQLVDCYMNAPALLTSGSYYTIAGVSVVVVYSQVLLKC